MGGHRHWSYKQWERGKSWDCGSDPIPSAQDFFSYSPVTHSPPGITILPGECTVRARIALWVHQCAQSGGGLLGECMSVHNQWEGGVLGECLSVLSPELDIEFHFQVSPTPLPPFRLSFRKILNKLCRETLNQCWPWICYLSISVSWVIGVSALCYTYTRGPFYSSLRENSFTFCTGLIEYQDVTFEGQRLWN